MKTTLLDIPHKTQIGNGVSNDCSQVCIQMLAPSFKLADIIAASGVIPNGYATFQNVYKALSFCNIPYEFWKPDSPTDIRSCIAGGFPVIALIGYGNLPASLKQATGNWPHFVLITGYDERNLFIHDPLGKSNTGAYVPIPDSIFELAFANVPYNMYGNQSVKITMEYPFVGDKTVSEDPVPALEMKIAELEMQIQQLRAIVASQAQTISSLRMLISI